MSRTKEELQAILSDANAQRMLGLIRATEGADYNTLFGGEKLTDLSKHPNKMKTFKQTDGKMNQTSAAGAYQFLGKTWNGLADQYDLQDFQPMSQDIGALALMDEAGALDDVLQGDYEAAISKLGNVWASLPSSTAKQPKKSWEFTNQYLAAQGAPAQEPRQIPQGAAEDVITGALAGMSAPNPGMNAAEAFAALRRDQLQAEADRLALASIDHEADTMRSNAVRGFFGEPEVKAAPSKLPQALEDSLSRALFGEA